MVEKIVLMLFKRKPGGIGGVVRDILSLIGVVVLTASLVLGILIILPIVLLLMGLDKYDELKEGKS